VSSQGHVVEVRTYPVKSMDGSSLSGADVTPSGLDGDRDWSVVDTEGAVVSARHAPQLRDVRVAATDDGPRLDVPGVANGVSGAAADEALTTYVGAPVHLAWAGGSVQEVAAVHLVSRQAVAAAIGTTSDDPACDIEAPRANLTLDLGATPPDGFERAWVGHEVAIGDVVLRVNQVPKHCLGVYAEVVRPGRINRGDPIEVRD
jgi:MOSC domain-containing protein